MTSGITRTIQRRYGYRPVPFTCPECGHTRAPLSTFPASNLLGVSALLWATSGRRPLFGAAIHCPNCGEPMTLADELARRRRRTSDG